MLECGAVNIIKKFLNDFNYFTSTYMYIYIYSSQNVCPHTLISTDIAGIFLVLMRCVCVEISCGLDSAISIYVCRP
jgi:hypothetical protein